MEKCLYIFTLKLFCKIFFTPPNTYLTFEQSLSQKKQTSKKGSACSKTKIKVHSKSNIKRMQGPLLGADTQNHRALDLTRSCWWNWGGSRAKLVASWHTGVRQLAVFSQVGWRWLAVSTLFYHLSLSWCRHRRRFSQWMWSAGKKIWNNSKCVAGSIYKTAGRC